MAWFDITIIVYVWYNDYDFRLRPKVYNRYIKIDDDVSDGLSGAVSNGSESSSTMTDGSKTMTDYDGQQWSGMGVWQPTIANNDQQGKLWWFQLSSGSCPSHEEFSR